MSSREIEDVLSSIRRLVSEDMRSVPRPPAAEGKLLLTPSLRVVEPGEPAAEDALLEDVVSRIGAGVPADAGWETDPAEGAWPGAEVVSVDLDGVDEAEVVVPAATGQDWEEEPAAAPKVEPQDLADPDMGSADQAEAEAVAEILREEEALAARVDTDTQEAPQDLFSPADTDEFNEEALRDLVRALIREELQGELGARMTRNVRKQVRAEIARAFGIQQLS